MDIDKTARTVKRLPALKVFSAPFWLARNEGGGLRSFVLRSDRHEVSPRVGMLSGNAPRVGLRKLIRPTDSLQTGRSRKWIDTAPWGQGSCMNTL